MGGCQATSGGVERHVGRWSPQLLLQLQGAVGLVELDIETASPQQVADPKDHLLAVEWLGQKVIGTEEKGAVPGGPAGVSGQHYHREEAEALANAAQVSKDLETVRLWHVQVEQHDVRLELDEDALDLVRFGHALDRAGLFGEEPLQHLDVVDFVVDDQDPVPDDRSSDGVQLTIRIICGESP